MVSAALRIVSLALWMVVAPIVVFALGIRLTQFWHVHIDVLLLSLIGLAAVVGGAALLVFARLSLAKRIGLFVAYFLFASCVLFLFYPAIVCTATQCP